MALRDGNWQIRLELPGGGKVLESSTDELTLGQIDVAERASGVPWALWDPRRSVRVAIGLFVVLLVRDGETEDAALKLAQELPGKVLTGAFTWVPPENPLPATPGAGEAPDPA